MSTRRSASVGALPLEKKHFVSRNESASGVMLDVRCACQYFQSDSLLPERVNPVDSRPGSKLEFHNDPQNMQPGFDPLTPGTASHQLLHMHPTSIQSVGGDQKLLAGERITLPDPERLSMRSVGKNRSWDQASASVDISFVEKYPELEQTARSRGLVVRSISDDDPHQGPAGIQRQRFTSVDRMSGHRDPETLSMHSVRSLRRISRSPSKGDLFVADININPPLKQRYERRSASASRRTSNVDLYRSISPQVNVISPTPMPQTIERPPNFTRHLTPQRSPSPPAVADAEVDYRIAKPPMTSDYMRPENNRDSRGYIPNQPGVTLPQNRPIDMSKYRTSPDETTVVESPTFESQPIFESLKYEKPTTMSTFRPIDPLQKTVTELEAIASMHNVEDIVDNIKIERLSPPLLENVPKMPVSVDEQTRIDISLNLPMVDVNQLVREEEEKARSRARSRSAERQSRRSRSKSPARPINRAKSMSPQRQLDSLQVPQEASYHQLKRGHSPDRESSPSTTKKMVSDDEVRYTTNGSAKPSYSERFKSMFSSKPKETDLAEPVFAQRERSPSPAPSIMRMPSMFSKDKNVSKRERSPSPAPSAFRMPSLFSKDKNMPEREKSPSPAPSGFRLTSMFTKDTNGKDNAKAPSPVPAKSKLMTVFSKEKPMASPIVAGTNVAVTNRPEAQVMSVKVMETFSLKVDEMDQYMSRPSGTSVTPALSKAPSVAKSIGGGEEIMESERLSMGISEPFAPVIIGRSASTQFSMDHSNLTLEMSRHDGVSKGLSREPSIHHHPEVRGKPLFSASMDITNQDSGIRGWSKEPSVQPETQGKPLFSASMEMASPESVSRGWSKEPSIHHHPEVGGKPLFSASIMLGSSGSFGQGSSPDRRAYIRGLRSPSEQRPLQQPENRNFLGGRTQSQDRQQLGGSQDNLSTRRMSKTVSFHFDERKSRLGDYESIKLGKQEFQKQEYLERTYYSRDHEYEPIGAPSTQERSSALKEQPSTESQRVAESNVDQMKRAVEMQKQMEDQFFKPAPPQPSPQMEITVDVEAHAEEPIDEQARPEKKGFMASAQDRTRKMHIGLKTQAGKLKTKLKPTAKKSPSASPKAKDRRMFKAPEFSKMKMPELKRLDMSKFKDFKRPEFTKFSKPDMSKFKLPEMSAIKLGRSKSFKEAEIVEDAAAETGESGKKPTEATSGQKKLFDFNFGTFPRAQRRKNKPIEPESSFGTGTATEATSVMPSTETQPSMESSGSPKGDRGPGPVRSRWADKFSDVSYNDSEGSRYRRYGSELESFDRESSLERRMREDLEDAVSEAPDMGILGVVTEDKQFAEFDEENRAIHEISNLRSKEFKRRPIVHQDSDLRSEDSKEAVGWTDREVQKNTLLRKAEIEAEASYLKYLPPEMSRQDNLSTASSGKKVVLEEIGEDEFFLRKRGISQDNIEINQYIRNAFRDGYDDKPINSLQHVGQPRDYGDYDVPPPKPRRLHKHYQPENDSQEFESYGDDLSVSHNGSDYLGAPRRPMRKGRSRSKFSMDSQEVKYVDDEYLRDPSHENGMWNNLNISGKENIPVRHERSLHDENDVLRPQAPRRQKRHRDNSMDKDSYINGFGGRSVSSSYLQPTEDVIVYRTEHEYHHVPIATPEKYSESVSTHKSGSHYDLEDRISRGAISLEQNDQQQQQQQVEETDRYVIDMMENDGYAVVRKEQVHKPTPPVRRKRFNHSPVDRFATMPNMRTRRGTPPPERPPPPRGYAPASDVGMITMQKSALSLDARPTYEDEYEEPGLPERNNLQSGEVINKMKYRPLPPPPRPPREKRNRSFSKSSNAPQNGSDEVDVVDGMEEDTGSHFEEVEASTQTDPLPDDFVCEEFEITDDMKIIEPRIRSQTVEDMLKEELEKELGNINHQFIDGDELAKGLQRFREANQRSLSERSRASSQADRSKSQSRPQTPSAIIVERHSATPVQKDNESMLEASLVVRPIDDLELEEEELRREGLLTDSSQVSIPDMKEEEEQYIPLTISEHSYDPSSAELDETLGNLASDPETQQTDEEVERTLQRYRDELDEIGRQLMEQETTSQELSPSASREEIIVSDREEPIDKPEPHSRSKRSTAPEDFKESDRDEISDREEPLERPKEELAEPWQLSDIDEMRSDLEEQQSEIEVPATPRNKEAEENTTIAEEYHVEIPLEERPLPPPRRKSTTAFDAPLASIEHEEPATGGKELTPLQTLDKKEEAAQLPSRISDLEVERLRVHALQAGQIMVSQLHGQQISSEELQCKSGNLVVQNIELPPGLIENIVERVRQTERSQLLTVETQTSLENSSESSPVREVVPPPKPPRLRDLEAVATAHKASEPVKNTDEQTQTDVEPAVIIPPTLATGIPNVFPTPEYLQSIAPLAFYNLHRAQAELADNEPRAPHRHRHRRSASPAEGDDISKEEESSEEPIRRRRTRSTRATTEEEPQSVTKAGSNFITACSLSLARVINQITDYLRGNEPKEGVEDATDLRSKQVPALVVLFIVITFMVLIYLVSGQNVHTHHWDYFNPPGQEGRPS